MVTKVVISLLLKSMLTVNSVRLYISFMPISTLWSLFLFSVHGSSISLVSTASSLYSSAEEKQAHEIRKLRRELVEAQEKVHTLTSQLSTNVSLFNYDNSRMGAFAIVSLFRLYQRCKNNNGYVSGGDILMDIN